MKFLEKNKTISICKDNNTKITFKSFLLFIFLFLLFSIPVSAGRDEQMTEEKPIQSDNADSEKGRLQEYCSYWSDITFNSKYGEADEHAIIQNSQPYAPIIDTINGTGRNNTSVGSENVLEYQGEYYTNYK